MPAVRPTWLDLPDGLRAQVAGLLDAPAGDVTARSQDGGFTPGAALRVHAPSSGHRLFLKAISGDHPLAGAYEAEAAAVAALPAAALRPELIWAGRVDGWVAMVLQDVPGRHPNLTPGSPDIPLVVEAIAAMSAALDPSPLAEAGPVTVPRGWRDLTSGQLTGDSAWAAPHLHELATIEDRWASVASGGALVHNDIRADNLLLTPARQVVVVDWAQARLGRPWRDSASLVPHLIMAGHTAGEAEALLTGPWEKADPDLITANAVALAGYLAKSAPLPPPPGVPYLRAYQQRAAAAVAHWVRHRTGW